METITTKVYLNSSRDGSFGFGDDAVLHHAATFELNATYPHTLALELVFEQLNIGGDLVEATDWCDAYRAADNRSLSVGDVVVYGEVAFAVGRAGWTLVPVDALVDALDARGRSWSEAMEYQF